MQCGTISRKPCHGVQSSTGIDAWMAAIVHGRHAVRTSSCLEAVMMAPVATSCRTSRGTPCGVVGSGRLGQTAHKATMEARKVGNSGAGGRLKWQLSTIQEASCS